MFLKSEKNVNYDVFSNTVDNASHQQLANLYISNRFFAYE